jgi:hypothetical protein
MLKLLLSLVPNDKPAYLVLDAATNHTIGILHLQVGDTVRYIFRDHSNGKLVSGGSMLGVLEEALAQQLEIDFTEPQDLMHSV